jgi:hypothetical protein
VAIRILNGKDHLATSPPVPDAELAFISWYVAVVYQPRAPDVLEPLPIARTPRSIAL